MDLASLLAAAILTTGVNRPLLDLALVMQAGLAEGPLPLGRALVMQVCLVVEAAVPPNHMLGKARLNMLGKARLVMLGKALGAQRLEQHL